MQTGSGEGFDCAVTRAIAALRDDLPYVLALSGGMDSMVLLHALATRGLNLRVLHVNHGLQAKASDWARFCVEQSACYGLQCHVLQPGQPAPGANVEAWAREQRYACLSAALRPAEILLTAHHQRDQAETVLLNLLRGSGLRGLAGMHALRSFGNWRLRRPLLEVSPDALKTYAERHKLAWQDDPSNADARFTRNYLRAEVLPRIRARFPSADAAMARSALLVQEALRLQQLELDEYLDGEALRLDVMAGLPLERRHHVLLQYLSCLQLPWPRFRMRKEIWRQMLEAAPDREPRVAWPGVELRRYRDRLYAMTPLTEDGFPQAWTVGAKGQACWAFGGYLQWTLPEAGVIDVYRGGEVIRHADGRHRRLKHLFQQHGVPPWLRRRMPLLYCAGELLAVGALWQASHVPGLQWRWLMENASGTGTQASGIAGEHESS